MDFDFIRSATSKELEQFKSVCNQLLSRTYIVRTLFRPGKGRVNNPDYTFLSLHYEAVQEYLSLLDWDLRKDDLNGYFYVINTDEANRCNLNKKETAILLALPIISRRKLAGLPSSTRLRRSSMLRLIRHCTALPPAASSFVAASWRGHLPPETLHRMTSRRWLTRSTKSVIRRLAKRKT